jgi:hypothetical protein
MAAKVVTDGQACLCSRNPVVGIGGWAAGLAFTLLVISGSVEIGCWVDRSTPSVELYIRLFSGIGDPIQLADSNVMCGMAAWLGIPHCPALASLKRHTSSA